MMTATSDASVQSREPVPMEVRVIAVILAIEVVIAMWMRLHAEEWLALFLTHLPALGLAGLAWGVVPDDSKARVRARVRRILGVSSVWWTLIGVLVALVITSCFVSSVHVASVDPDVRTRVRLVSGERRLGDSAQLRVAESQPLNRLTTPITFRTWFRQPFGARMWVVGGHLATVSRHVYPWRPTMLQFPDDFDTLATLAILPTTRISAYGRERAWPEFTLRDASDTTIMLLRDSITPSGLLIGFPDVALPDSATRAAWNDTARAFARADMTPNAGVEEQKIADADAKSTSARWAQAPSRRSERPLILGDSLFWELTSRDGKSRTSGKLRVTHATTELFLNP